MDFVIEFMKYTQMMAIHCNWLSLYMQCFNCKENQVFHPDYHGRRNRGARGPCFTASIVV